MFEVPLLSMVVVIMARRSPHADVVETLTMARDNKYSTNIMEDALLDAPGLVRKYGYPIEIHNVQTLDGYILEMHRIPHGRDRYTEAGNKTVVFLMHGLLSSSADFLVLGPGLAIAYLLADKGYDVWLGNARGNFYSRRHISLDPNDGTIAYWLFSWDEIGYYDLPAMIDYALNVTNKSKLHYIGHSQGGTVFLVLNSLRPEYNEKFIALQGLAPASFFHYNDHPFFMNLATYEGILEPLTYFLGIGAVLGYPDIYTWFATEHCSDDSILQKLCFMLFISGDNLEQFNNSMIPIFLGHAPAGASVRQFAHYGQCMHYKTFRRFYYNFFYNIYQYGSYTPPDYDLSKITVPSYIYYSLADNLVHPKDVHVLAAKLPNVAELFEVKRQSFRHIDFIWSMDVITEVYERMMFNMNQAEELVV